MKKMLYSQNIYYLQKTMKMEKIYRCRTRIYLCFVELCDEKSLKNAE